MDFQRITLIGSGRVATQLGLRLHRLGKNILQVYSRNLQNAQTLANQIEAQPVSEISQLTPDADIYILAVSDNAIEALASNLKIDHKIVVHTSGSTAMSAIAPVSPNHGVFYPLQTFTKEKTVDFSKVPFCIEASNQQTETALAALAGELSQDVRFINSQQRLMVHVAAVFVSNFTNYMYLIGEELLESTDVRFDILKPLIEESAAKVGQLLPHQAQTGPALRGDDVTIQKHLKVLEDFPDKQLLYKLLSEKIRTHFNYKNHYDNDR